MNEDARRAIIPELEDLLHDAKDLRQRMGWLYERNQLWQDKTSPEGAAMVDLTNAGYSYVRDLTKALDTLKSAPGGVQYVQDCVASWYEALHWDMSDPLVAIDEHEVQKPVFESVEYQGLDHEGRNIWIVVMTSTTHGREKIVVHSDSASYCDIYSAEKK